MDRVLKNALVGGAFQTSPIRSRIMASIRGKGNRSTETAVRMMLVRAGVRGWTSHVKSLPGRPDFVFPARKAAIFVHGCFWHAHGRCRGGHLPTSNAGYWTLKLAQNKVRDTANRRKLKRLGWRVLTIWECELARVDPEDRLRRFLAQPASTLRS